MKKPSFNDYPLNALMYFIERSEYQNCFEELRQAINYNLLRNYDYNEIYLAFKKSEGNKRKVYAYCLITFQKINGYFIERDVFEEIIEQAKFEDLWYLSKSAVNPYVREKCFEKICELIDETFENNKEFKRVLKKRGKKK